MMTNMTSKQMDQSILSNHRSLGTPATQSPKRDAGYLDRVSRRLFIEPTEHTTGYNLFCN